MLRLLQTSSPAGPKHGESGEVVVVDESGGNVRGNGVVPGDENSPGTPGFVADVVSSLTSVVLYGGIVVMVVVVFDVVFVVVAVVVTGPMAPVSPGFPITPWAPVTTEKTSEIFMS